MAFLPMNANEVKLRGWDSVDFVYVSGDSYVDHPVNLMMLMDCDKGKVETPIWDKYKEIIAKYDDRVENAVGELDRFDFYEEAKTAYCIIATSESAIYANVMLQKGVV